MLKTRKMSEEVLGAEEMMGKLKTNVDLEKGWKRIGSRHEQKTVSELDEELIKKKTQLDVQKNA
jgi:hypothetical protein